MGKEGTRFEHPGLASPPGLTPGGAEDKWKGAPWTGLSGPATPGGCGGNPCRPPVPPWALHITADMWPVWSSRGSPGCRAPQSPSRRVLPGSPWVKSQWVSCRDCCGGQGAACTKDRQGAWVLETSKPQQTPAQALGGREAGPFIPLSFLASRPPSLREKRHVERWFSGRQGLF